MKPTTVTSAKTEKLYYHDSMASSFDAVCLSCVPAQEGLFEVVLDRTLFFPEGGGQTADTGTIAFADALAQVLDVHEIGDAIVHFTDLAIPMGPVHGELDFKSRFTKMQNHGGEHILSGLIHGIYGYDNVGFHMGGEVTLDVSGPMSDADITIIEDRANEAVWANRPITTAFYTAAEAAVIPYRSKIDFGDSDIAVRLVTVEGVDTCACCAPHLPFTGCIGAVKILDFIPYKGGTRIFFRCGADALADHRKRLQLSNSLSAFLSAKFEAIPEAVAQLKAENERLGHAIVALQRQAVIAELARLQAAENGSAALFLEEGDMNLLRFASTEMLKAHPSLLLGAAFGWDGNGGWRYCICGSGIPLREIGKILNARFFGKGGGKDEMISGSLRAEKDELQAFLEELAL